MTRLARIVFGGSMVFVVATRPAAPAAAAVDPCSLLTPAQVAAALGVPEVKTSQGEKRCGWVPKKYAPGSKQAYLQLEDEKGFEAARTRPAGVVTPVNGIGDAAVQVTTQGIRTILTVKKKDVVFAVSVMGLPVDQAKTAEQTLAKQAVSKL